MENAYYCKILELVSREFHQGQNLDDKLKSELKMENLFHLLKFTINRQKQAPSLNQDLFQNYQALNKRYTELVEKFQKISQRNSYYQPR